MPGIKKVKELMLLPGEYPAIRDTDSLKEALETLREYREGQGHHHRSLLVFNNEDKLVGILTIRGIMDGVQRNMMHYENTELWNIGWAALYRKDAFKKYTISEVKQVMRPLIEAWVSSDDTVNTAIKLMMTKKVNILPVFKDGKAVGILRLVDILNCVSEFI